MTAMEKLSMGQLELKAQAKLQNLTHSFINSMVLKWAVELGVADVIHGHGEPITASQLAAALPIHPSKAQHVARLMRLLAHSGVFGAGKTPTGGECTYLLTAESRLLVQKGSAGASPPVTSAVSAEIIESWKHLSAWFQSEESGTAFTAAHSVDFWDYGRADSTFSSAFAGRMARDSQIVAGALVGTPEMRRVFEGAGSLVDVGGGVGTLSRVVAAEFPAMKCIVLDMPHVVAGLEGSHNLKFVGGDMFEAVPVGDVVLLKMILHDWSDEESVKILEQCRKAITASPESEYKKGKVIVIDMVVQSECDDHEAIETQLFYDLQMMVLFNGRERSEKEWAKLFSDAGFSGYKITPGLGMKSLIEVYP